MRSCLEPLFTILLPSVSQLLSEVLLTQALRLTNLIYMTIVFRPPGTSQFTTSDVRSLDLGLDGATSPFITSDVRYLNSGIPSGTPENHDISSLPPWHQKPKKRVSEGTPKA